MTNIVCMVSIDEGGKVNVQFPQTLNQDDRAFITACVLAASGCDPETVCEIASTMYAPTYELVPEPMVIQ